LSYLEHAYWTFTPDADRRLRAPNVERVLRAGLTSAATPSLKGAYIAALRGVALTPETVGWLTRVWRGDEVVTGLTLAEPDFITLAQALAVREVPGWKAILEQQIGRTMNRIGRRVCSSSSLRCRRIQPSAIGSSRHSPTWRTGVTSRGCWKGSAICTTRCGRRRPSSTSIQA
jgi:hypothetical protein